MRWRAFGVGSACLSLIAVLWACVGDDPAATSSALPGERGGPCNAGKCLEGLQCVDNRCVLTDGAASSTSSGGNVEGGANECPPPAYVKDVRVTCPGGGEGSRCSGTQVCCRTPDKVSCGAPATCPLPKDRHTCETAGHCVAGQICCGSTKVAVDPNACPIKTDFPGGTECQLGGNGCKDGPALCLLGDDKACGPTEVCRRAELGKTSPILAGICVKK